MSFLDRYRLAFADEFDFLSLANTRTSTANWYTGQAWGGGFGSARFIPSNALNLPFSIVDKEGETALSIAMTRNSDGKLESGLISNTFPDGTSTTPQDGDPTGYYEIRSWLPEGQGIWPAFWSLEKERLSSSRDYVYEIDIMEHYGAAMPDRYTSHVHEWNWNGTSLEGHSSQYSRNVVGANVLASGWHTYGLEILESEIVFYFDGKSHFTVPRPAKLDSDLMFMIDLAAGGGWPIDPNLDHVNMYIDYFRVYERREALPTVTTSTSKNDSWNSTGVTEGGTSDPTSGSRSGIDVVHSAVSYTLPLNARKLILSGKAAINGKGNSGNNELVGNSGANTLSGQAGDDRLDGGYGKDVLTGGSGKDAFVFSSKLALSSKDRKLNLDALRDFNVKYDRIYLDNNVFAKLGKGSSAKPASLKKDYFRVDASKDKNDYVVYERKTGLISYDPDGSGVKFKPVFFAQTGKNLPVTHLDFFII